VVFLCFLSFLLFMCFLDFFVGSSVGIFVGWIVNWLFVRVCLDFVGRYGEVCVEEEYVGYFMGGCMWDVLLDYFVLFVGFFLVFLLGIL